jgi:hypothetical protein
LSPVWGTRIEDEKADESECSDELTDGDVVSSDEPVPIEMMDADGDAASEEEDVVSMDEMVELELVEDSRSEWASVYLTVLISSSKGVRKDTFFSAGNSGRAGAILRGIKSRAGLFVRMETRLCGCLYGIRMVADSFEEADVRADESVEAELGVEQLGGFEFKDLEKELSIESPRRGFCGRLSEAGAAALGAS